MLALQVEITGRTTDDLVLALEEAARLVAAGNTSGRGENEDGGLFFNISGDEA